MYESSYLISVNSYNFCVQYTFTIYVVHFRLVASELEPLHFSLFIQFIQFELYKAPFVVYVSHDQIRSFSDKISLVDPNLSQHGMFAFDELEEQEAKAKDGEAVDKK